MDVAAPYRIFTRDLDVRILIELSRAAQPLSGREVGVRIGASSTGVRHALDRLVDGEVVFREPVGRAYGHTLNREHVAFTVVQALRNMRRAVLAAAHDCVGSWSIPPMHAAFFGSFARQDGDEASDLDILLIRPATLDDEPSIARWEEQVAELDRLREMTGNAVQILDLPDHVLRSTDPAHLATLKAIAADEISLGPTRLRTLMVRNAGKH